MFMMPFRKLPDLSSSSGMASSSAGVPYLPLGLRVLFIIYFVTHIPITILIDGQVRRDKTFLMH